MFIQQVLERDPRTEIPTQRDRCLTDEQRVEPEVEERRAFIDFIEAADILNLITNFLHEPIATRGSRSGRAGQADLCDRDFHARRNRGNRRRNSGSRRRNQLPCCQRQRQRAAVGPVTLPLKWIRRQRDAVARFRPEVGRPIDAAAGSPQRADHAEEWRGVSVLRQRCQHRIVCAVGDGLTRECHAALAWPNLEQCHRAIRREATNAIFESHRPAQVARPVLRRLHHLRRHPGASDI